MKLRGALDEAKQKLGYYYRLKSMKRYNNSMMIKEESVAEHSFFVTLFTLLLCSKQGMGEREMLRHLILAICHDLPELEISDIPHNIKLNHPELEKIVADCEKKWYDENMDESIKKLVCNDFSMTSLVEIADVLSVIQYCSNELILGNLKACDIKQKSEERIEQLLDD